MADAGRGEWQRKTRHRKGKQQKQAAEPIVTNALQPRLQVAAIDFGTTYSGYAFSFRSEFKSDPLKITASQWKAGANRTVSLKTPTCALFKPSGEFHSFGFDAEDKYAELATDEQHLTWFYFKRFKMLLYQNKTLNRKTELVDDKGLKMSAMTVITACIRYLKDHMLEMYKDRKVDLHEDEIHWVLTVPAIWQDNAKQFMREAAVDAGISSDHLSLALEPEAASLFCRYLPVTKIQRGGGHSISCFEPSKRYLVLDAGGGTVDITVHETQEVFVRGESGDNEISSYKGAVREICRANGGPWGGTKIDEAYLELLNNVVGKDVMEAFARMYTDDYLDMFREFEIKKTLFSGDLEDKITFRIPSSIAELYSKMKGQDFRRSLMMQQSLQDQITFTGDKLRTKPDQIRNLFTRTCKEIVNHLKAILEKPETAGTDTIVMVGGFSESGMLQHAIKTNFPDKLVIIPEEAGLAVLKGAVIFGHNPSAIVSRVSKFTYGVKTNNRFKSGVHSEARKFTDEDGVVRCSDCFSKHVEIDEVVKVGESFEEHNYSPLYKSQKKVTIKVFTSTKKDPLYADEAGCTKIGQVTVDLSGLDPNEKQYRVQMIYGNTELGVRARILKTGKVVKASFNFLG